MATIRRTTQIGGVLANVTSLILCDPTGTYGVKRNDTSAVVVAANTPMTNVSVGTYEYTFADIDGVSYTAWLKRVYAGQTQYAEIVFAATEATVSSTLEAIRSDMDTFLSEWGESCTRTRLSLTYDSEQVAVETWGSSASVTGDFQALTGKEIAAEAGLEHHSEYKVYMAYNADVVANDRITRNGETFRCNYTRSHECHQVAYVYREVVQ